MVVTRGDGVHQHRLLNIDCWLVFFFFFFFFLHIASKYFRAPLSQLLSTPHCVLGIIIRSFHPRSDSVGAAFVLSRFLCFL